MNQEEVSVIRKSFEDNGTLISNENHEKDVYRSRKDLVMKTNGKKRMFALLMCAMMIISTMSVWAAYKGTTIGKTAEDQALCELYLSSTLGQAFTTPSSTANTVATTISVIGETSRSDGGASVATVSVRNAISAISTHQAGPYYTSLTVSL